MSQSSEEILSAVFSKCFAEIFAKDDPSVTPQIQEYRNDRNTVIDVDELRQQVDRAMELTPLQLLGDTLHEEGMLSNLSCPLLQKYWLYRIIYSNVNGTIPILPSLNGYATKVLNYWLRKTGSAGDLWITYPVLLVRMGLLTDFLRNVVAYEEKNMAIPNNWNEEDKTVIKQFKVALAEDWFTSANVASEDDKATRKIILLIAIETNIRPPNEFPREIHGQLVEICNWEVISDSDQNCKIEHARDYILCLRRQDILYSPRMMLLACLYDFIDKFISNREQDIDNFRNDFEKRYEKRPIPNAGQDSRDQNEWSNQLLRLKPLGTYLQTKKHEMPGFNFLRFDKQVLNLLHQQIINSSR